MMDFVIAMMKGLLVAVKLHMVRTIRYLKGINIKGIDMPKTKKHIFIINSVFSLLLQ